jgi:hypothetical protein
MRSLTVVIGEVRRLPQRMAGRLGDLRGGPVRTGDRVELVRSDGFRDPVQGRAIGRHQLDLPVDAVVDPMGMPDEPHLGDEHADQRHARFTGPGAPTEPVGAGYSVLSGGLRVLMDQPTKSISPHDPPSRHDDS